MTGQRMEFDNVEVKGGYDHDGAQKKARAADRPPPPPKVEPIGQCSFCHRPALYEWPKLDDRGRKVLFCHDEHWTRQLMLRAQDIREHPENYKEDATDKRGPRRGRGGAKPAGRGGYGAKGNANWARRNAK